MRGRPKAPRRHTGAAVRPRDTLPQPARPPRPIGGKISVGKAGSKPEGVPRPEPKQRALRLPRSKIPTATPKHAGVFQIVKKQPNTHIHALDPDRAARRRQTRKLLCHIDNMRKPWELRPAFIADEDTPLIVAAPEPLPHVVESPGTSGAREEPDDDTRAPAHRSHTEGNGHEDQAIATPRRKRVASTQPRPRAQTRPRARTNHRPQSPDRPARAGSARRKPHDPKRTRAQRPTVDLERTDRPAPPRVDTGRSRPLATSKRSVARRVLAAIDPAHVAAELLSQTRQPGVRLKVWENLMEWNEPEETDPRGAEQMRAAWADWETDLYRKK